MSSSQHPISKRLQGKVALITGGASGIGACAAKLFAQNGAKVTIADVQSDLGHSVAEEISSVSTYPVAYVQCDVSKESDVQAAVDGVVSAHGKLDIMYSNAGIMGKLTGMQILTADSQDFSRVLEVNVKGAFHCAKHAARVMVPQKSGTILFTASSVTETYGNAPHAYTASKAATVGLMKNLCVELGAYGIRVNSISPDGVPTPMAMNALGMDRKAIQALGSQRASLKGTVLDENDIAEAALYLASEESKFVSGLNLVVDGGYNLKSA
ncbi:Short chain aldehyde dehydrogenase 1 [Linum grandiflorum]